MSEWVTIPRTTLERWRDTARAAGPGDVWIIAAEASSILARAAQTSAPPDAPLPWAFDTLATLAYVDTAIAKALKANEDAFADGLRHYDKGHREHYHGGPPRSLSGLTLSDLERIMHEHADGMSQLIDGRIAAHIRTAHLPASYTVTATPPPVLRTECTTTKAGE